MDNPSVQEKRDYQEQKAKAFYREASCAAITFYDEEGERLKTIRFGRDKGLSYWTSSTPVTI